MKTRMMALLLSTAVLCTMGIQATAAEVGAAEQPTALTGGEVEQPAAVDSQEEPVQVTSLRSCGQVVEIHRDEQGAMVSLALETQTDGLYVMLLSEQTVWIDSGKQAPSDPATLQVGETVYIDYGPDVAMSMPPQAQALAVVRNVPQDGGSASYHVAEEVTQREDGSWAILTDNGGLYMFAGENTGVSSYDGDEVTLANLSQGAAFIAWYDVVLESYPAQTYPGHIILLPQEPEEGAKLTMELDGQVPNMVGRYECGTAMVPVAAVAQALGFQVTYTPDTDQGTLVTVESDTFAVRLYIDLGLIYGVTKVEGAVGMTGPQSYGMTPYIVAPGTTWAPAEIFQMLGKTVALEGTNLVIS